jgi:formate-dependent nitrite reductase membrane component NrfD
LRKAAALFCLSFSLVCAGGCTWYSIDVLSRHTGKPFSNSVGSDVIWLMHAVPAIGAAFGIGALLFSRNKEWSGTRLLKATAYILILANLALLVTAILSHSRGWVCSYEEMIQHLKRGG